MKHRLSLAWLGFAALLGGACPAGAAGDAAAGEAKAQACAACHGPGGNASTIGMPSLAGQPPLYVYYQLLQYREKRRVDAQMSPMAAGLTDRDMQDLAAYFAAQKPAGFVGKTSPQRIEAGRALSQRHHCGSCHLPALTGQNHIPRLAGQNLDYLRAQLRGFRTGTRPDIDGTMTSAAQPLGDDDIENLAHYLASLP